MSKNSNNLKKIAITTSEYFYIRDTPEEIKTLDELIDKLDETYLQQSRVFRDNLSDSVGTMMIPFVLATAGIEHGLQVKFTNIEAINNAFSDNKTDDVSEVHSRARLVLQEHFKDKENVNQLAYDACEFLIAISYGKVKSSSRLLIQQGAVLFWGVFETLAKDIIITYINNNPDAIKLISDNPYLYKRLEVKNISLSDLIEHGLDVSTKMGIILFQNQNFSDLTFIRNTYNALLPETKKHRSILNDKTLWLMLQQRHLIAHNSGIVDKQYIEKTGTELNLGEPILITPDQLREYIILIIKSGCSILESLPSKDPNQ